jgi:nitrous-oxide reductase
MKKIKNEKDKSVQTGVSRRNFLKGGVAIGAGATAVPMVGGLGILGSANAQASSNKGFIAPGELDDYYGFWSSGQAGEVRIIGVPSMREVSRIPVFNRCSATGWGQTNESLNILTEGLTDKTKKLLMKIAIVPSLHTAFFK